MDALPDGQVRVREGRVGEAVAEREAGVEREAVRVVVPVADEQFLGVESIEGLRHIRHSRPLLWSELRLVLDVRESQRKLGRRIDLAEEDVGDGVASLLAGHEVGQDGGHILRPRHQHCPGHACHDDHLRAGLRDCSHEVLIADGKVVAVRALGGETTDEDDGVVGGLGQLRCGLRVRAIVELDLGTLSGSATHTIQRPRDERGHHAARAAGMHDGLVVGLANHGQSLALGKGQDGTIILQQDSRDG
mmetsp:Transcript_31972/g.92417  ORF Transcript_31972/g.92417 Transcript_31972/m.92417 type:complete len:247 (+) Transcript_31972:394-1134(+)